MAETITYTAHGEIDYYEGGIAAIGLAMGDTVNATLTVQNANTDTYTQVSTPLLALHDFAQSLVSYSFTIAHPGAAPYFSHNGSAAGLIESFDFFTQGGVFFGAGNWDPLTDALGIYATLQGDAVPLQSLAGLPTNSSGIAGLFGLPLYYESGSIQLAGYDGFLGFQRNAAITPIPATLPLFASALGALGIVGWKRRRAEATAVAA